MKWLIVGRYFYKEICFTMHGDVEKNVQKKQKNLKKLKMNEIFIRFFVSIISTSRFLSPSSKKLLERPLTKVVKVDFVSKIKKL